MSASSAASSSLTRARTSILVLSALAAASGIYYIYISRKEEEETVNPSLSLHRSNAVHRRQRRERRSAVVPAEPAQLTGTDTSGETEEGSQVVARPLTDGETIVDDQAYQSDFSFAEPQPYTRSGQNIVQLLFRVSEDATRRNAYVHRGCQCNACNMVPIRGIRYRCANCADFDLCEGCEAQGLHNKTHIFYKVKVPAPSFGPRNIQPVWYTGDPETTAKLLPKALLNNLSRETGFERPELDAYWEQWTFMANTDWRYDPDDINLAMDRKTFERCLVPSGGSKHAPPSLIFDRMFAFYDTNKDDLISFPEFLHGLAYRKKKGKWQKIFEGYDIDNDGYVDRKDFLRMFRSYYVLYRQMHRDMLEGMDEQQMSSVDAHRLVNSRQPLSGAFGQDGRYPAAPENRREGKMVQANGDFEINDGKGVMNESGDDTGNREDVFRRPGRNPWSSTRPRNSGGFWDVMLNPPATVEQMTDVLRNLNRARDSVEVDLNANHNAHPILQMSQQEAENGEESSDDSEDESIENDENWPPNSVTITDEDAAAVAGPGTRVADLGRENRSAVTSYAIQRERVQREINERWKRRQFYTDEEEGATAPADWNEDDDILTQAVNGESSKGQSRPSAHSRSSSKVRFAEEIDDFDTRSNPSTSSRSVPERWGGMEIPDAEKDAGKEILYQVTQQAFNELLDSLFKAKEDLALEAAETKADREKYREMFENPRFESWAKNKEAEDEKKEGDQTDSSLEQENQDFPFLFPAFREVEVEQSSEQPTSDMLEDHPRNRELGLTEVVAQVRQQTLLELLEATGYTVEDSVVDVDADAVSSLQELRDRPDQPRSVASHASSHSPPEWFPGAASSVESSGNTNLYVDSTNSTSYPQSASPSEALSIIAQYDEDSISPPSTIHPTPPSSESSFRDPTLPQFRPNTIESEPKPAKDVPARNFEAPSKPNRPLTQGSTSPQSTFPAQRTYSGLSHLSGVLNETTNDSISEEYLLKLRRADKAEKEKEERGGWGRLNFKEWETMVKRFSKEGKGNQMDYLGSWIEFCIP